VVGTKMENGGYVLVAQGGSSASFSEEALTRYFACEVSTIDNFERDGAPKVGVECLIGDAHCAPTELPQGAIFAPEYLVMLIVLGVGHGFVALTNQKRTKEANGMGTFGPSS
jgi:hypothetical protein